MPPVPHVRTWPLALALALALAAPLLPTAARAAPPPPSAPAPAGNPAAGKKVFETSCVACHGATGKGDGVAAAALNPKPRDFTSAEKMAGSTPERRLKVVTEGGTAAGLSATMPAFRDSLSEQQIRDVLAYVDKTFLKSK